MDYARHIGRIGALAIALGVGMAVATTPGTAFADPSSTSTSDSASTSDSTDAGDTGPGETGSTDSAPSDDAPADDDTEVAPDDDEPSVDDEEPVDEPADQDSSDEADDDSSAVTDDEGGEPADGDTSPAEDDSQRGDGGVADDTPETSAVSAPASDAPEPTGAAEDDGPSAADASLSTTAETLPVEQLRVTTFSAETASQAAALTAVTPVATPTPRPNLVTVAKNFVASLLRPLLSFGEGSPIQFPILTAVLAAVRNEFDRILSPRTTRPAAQQTVSQLVDPTSQRVLVIGVDGTNLSRILADDYNKNFFALMNTSTTAASSIVGHTTISNPSWSAILTGVWGERTGVINNVFTPWTYNKWPTVFNQLESLDRDIDTMAVGNWNVINAIAGAGSIPADHNVFIGQLPGDTDWLATDDAVGDVTVAAITGADAPNFLFSYFVGVDENGHLYGGASQQYRDAIRNMDDNLGEIMAAVASREAATGEDWTILVVTDHGHQPQKGFGHGFQSPDETETFVIADGPAFKDGYINLAYEIVDTTPTVVSLFGGTPRPRSDGVPLTTLSGSDVLPADLHQALKDAIAENDYPNIVTNVALSLRTIFASVPYFIYEFGIDFAGEVPDFLVVPVKLVFDGLYVVTNVPAQIVAFLTGVSGARLFPLFPPPPPDFPSEGAPQTVLVCGAATADSVCGQSIVA